MAYCRLAMSLLSPENTGWFVIRTRPKSEHLAAQNLRQVVGLPDVFCPRIRFEKATVRGKVWFTEALFPGYCFARFDLAIELRHVSAATGVTGVLRFGGDYALISEELIGQLQEEFGRDGQSLRTIAPEIGVGSEVLITSGAMQGLHTLVTKVLSGGERVRVLLEWLGQEREVDISLRDLGVPGDVRRIVQQG